MSHAYKPVAKPTATTAHSNPETSEATGTIPRRHSASVFCRAMEPLRKTLNPIAVVPTKPQCRKRNNEKTSPKLPRSQQRTLATLAPSRFHDLQLQNALARVIFPHLHPDAECCIAWSRSVVQRRSLRK